MKAADVFGKLILPVRWLGELVGRDVCPVCETPLRDDEEAVCLNCLAAMPRTFNWYNNSQGVLAEILSNGPAPAAFSAAWMHYDPAMPWARIIRSAKYHDRPALARNLGALFAVEMCAAAPQGMAEIDTLLPVPMYWWKRMKRGYNQSVEIARGIASVTGADVSQALRFIKPHSTQTHKNRVERMSSLTDTVVVRHPERLAGKHIAIVDDVITTGSTMRECVVALSRAHVRPASISILALGLTKS